MVTRPVLGVVDPRGRLHLEPFAKAQMARTLSELRGQQVEVTVTRYKASRSQQANRYLFGVVYALMAAEIGCSVEELHDAMCAKFLPDERKRLEFVNKLTGETETVEIDPRRSSKLKGDAFFAFVESVRLWGVEFLGVITPDPDPAWREKKRQRAA